MASSSFTGIQQDLFASLLNPAQKGRRVGYLAFLDPNNLSHPQQALYVIDNLIKDLRSALTFVKTDSQQRLYEQNKIKDLFKKEQQSISYILEELKNAGVFSKDVVGEIQSQLKDLELLRTHLVSFISKPEKPQSAFKALHTAIEIGDLEAVSKIFHDNPNLDVNTQDRLSGRTAAHIAASACACDNHLQILLFLLLKKADLFIQDRSGFTALELLINKHPVQPLFFINSYFNQRIQDYHQFFITELNAQYNETNRRHDNPLASESVVRNQMVLVNDTYEMVRFIEDYNNRAQHLPAHAHYTQIGFLVRTPNIRKTIINQHDLSAFLYTPGPSKTSSLIQIDTLGQIFPVPHVEGMIFYYNPFFLQRDAQQSNAETSISLLHFVMTKYPCFVEFCQTHSRDLSAIASPIADEEQAELNELQSRGVGSSRHQYLWNKETFALYDQLYSSHAEFECKSEVKRSAPASLEMSYRPLQLQILQITELPCELLAYCENYTTVRQYRKEDKLGHSNNYPVLKQLLQHGERRQVTLSDRSILANLLTTTVPHSSPHKKETISDSKYDIAGRSYLKRNTQWTLCRESRYKTLYRLFYKKLSDVPCDRLQALASEVENTKSAIADTIASFATHYPRTK